jgi:hypothetical protein
VEATNAVLKNCSSAETAKTAFFASSNTFREVYHHAASSS